MELARRKFLSGLVALVAAPAVVRAGIIMPISAAKLWTPPTDIIGAIKAIVGPVPDGWLSCDGRWLVSQDYPALHAILGNKYGQDTGSFGSFHLPDMRTQAWADRRSGADVGRYVIYGGNDRIVTKRKLDQLVDSMSATPIVGAVDKWSSI